MIKLSQSNALAALVAAVLAVLIPMTSPAQTTESTLDSLTEAADIAQSGTDNRTQHGAPTEDGPLEDFSDPTVVEVEIQRYINELRREQLDDRATTITWWLAVVAIVLTFFGVVAAIAGFLGFRKFEAIRHEAEVSAGEAKRLVKEIRRHRDESQELVQEMTAEAVAENPQQARQTIRDVREDPDASLVDKAIADVISLQEEEKTEEAIEKWRAIANITERTEKSTAARAWFSVGYLLKNENLEEKVLAYDKSIRLKPVNAAAINNRGIAKSKLGRHDEAITDYDEAIRLQPDYARAYFNRGITKGRLRRHDDAITDYDEAIRLQPDYAHAYQNRGNTKRVLRRFDGARKDFETALKFAKEANDAERVAKIEQHLRQLETEENS